MGMVAYLTLIGFIVVLVNGSYKKSDFVRFHLNQALTLFLCSLVAVIPFVGWIASMAVFVLFVISFLGAINGEKKPAPIVGNFNLIK